MFQRKLFILIGLVSFVCFSCTKENQINRETSPLLEVLVKTKTTPLNTVETYYYDAQKRVSKIEFVEEDGTSYYYSYTYTANEVSEYKSNQPIRALEETLPNGTIRMNCTSNPRTYKLNAEGYYVGYTTNCESLSIKYDKNGFIVSESHFMIDFSGNQYFKNDGKNIIDIANSGTSYGGGEFTNKDVYSYFLDKVNTIGNQNFGKTFLGKSSENLVKTIAATAENNFEYTYEFDEEGRVTASTVKNLKLNEQAKTYYSYY